MPLCRWERRGKGEDCEKAKSKTARAPPLRQAGGVCTCSYRAGVDEPRSLSSGSQRSGGSGHRRSGDSALAVRRARIKHLNIEELEVGRLHVRELVVEQEQTPQSRGQEGGGA